MQKVALFIENINERIGGFLWGPPMLAFFLFVGLFFSLKTNFFQITGFFHWIRYTVASIFKKSDNSGNLTQWQAFATALAGTLGTGNIIGVATAISLGGAGAVFWMWISALLGMMTAFSERVLGILYREKDKHGRYRGGPMYYIEKGLGSHGLAVVYAVFCVGASFGMGTAAQSNAVAVSMAESFGVPPFISGIITALLAGIIIFGGVKRIGRVNEILMPVISLFYIGGCLTLIFMNRNAVLQAISEIFRQAFSFKAVGGGVGGYVIIRSMKYGISRGVFSNEAGLGASVIVHSTAEVDHPVKQGMWGIFEVFLDTIVVCTLTAFAILTSPAASMEKGGEILTLTAFKAGFGNAGAYFLSISIALFAVASIVGWSFYGQSAFEYLSGSATAYRLLYLIFTVLGAILSLELVWELSDTLNGLMAIPNLIAVLYLSGDVKRSFESFRSATGKKRGLFL